MTSSIPVSIPVTSSGDVVDSTTVTTAAAAATISPSKKLAARRTLRLAIPKLQQAESMQNNIKQQQQQQQMQASQQAMLLPPPPPPPQPPLTQPLISLQSQASSYHQSNKKTQQLQQKNIDAITRLIQNERSLSTTGGGTSGNGGRVSYSDGSTCSSGASSADISRPNTNSFPGDSEGFLFKHRMQEFPATNAFGGKGKNNYYLYFKYFSFANKN